MGAWIHSDESLASEIKALQELELYCVSPQNRRPHRGRPVANMLRQRLCFRRADPADPRRRFRFHATMSPGSSPLDFAACDRAAMAAKPSRLDESMTGQRAGAIDRRGSRSTALITVVERSWVGPIDDCGGAAWALHHANHSLGKGRSAIAGET